MQSRDTALKLDLFTDEDLLVFSGSMFFSLLLHFKLWLIIGRRQGKGCEDQAGGACVSLFLVVMRGIKHYAQLFILT